jgi:hypothetical protein
MPDHKQAAALLRLLMGTDPRGDFYRGIPR